MINVIDYLENATLKYPKKIAVIQEDKNITYEDLNKFSKAVGSFIAGKVFNEPIIVFMDKGIDTLITFFGTVYAGCFYSLINPEFPEVRISQIKNTLSSKIVITDDYNMKLAKELFNDLEVFNINELKKNTICEELLNNIKDMHIDTDPVYVNFTSGSTGIPKGVLISHKSVIDFIDIFTSTFAFKTTDIIANQAPFDFDVSVKDIYSSLKMGATLVIVPKKYFSNPSLLLDYITNNKVTTLIWAVSALCLITTFHGLDYKTPESINKILFSGEVMPLKHLKIWMQHLPHTTFVNLYGPTEITCNCTYHIIDKNRNYEEAIPIGKHFPNERVILLDEDDNIIDKKNTIGEICISGTCVGLGYYNNKEQTDKHFTNLKENKMYYERIYKTGDLAYINSFDELVFKGRKDFQVKYMGHRIELEEIDKAMMSFKEVIRSCTIFDEEKQKIYGFYIGDIEKNSLHAKLKEILPVFMVPTILVKKEEFPMTKNGKIDRKALIKTYMEEKK